MGGPSTVNWRERSPRAGWDITYTSVGARLSAALAVESSEESKDEARFQAAAERLTSHCLVATSPELRFPDVTTDSAHFRWSSTVRRLLQRGMNPRVSPLLDMRSDRASLTPREVVGLLVKATAFTELDPSIELHPTWEQPFWDIITTEYPLLAPWIVPQVSLEALVGAQDDGEERWVDFAFFPPWREQPVVIEIDGSGHSRSSAVDAARDDALRTAGIAVHRIPGQEIRASDAPFRKALDRANTEASQFHSSNVDADVLIPLSAHRLAFAISLIVDGGALVAGDRTWTLTLSGDLGLPREAIGWALDFLLAADRVMDTGILPGLIQIDDMIWVLQADGYVLNTAGPVPRDSGKPSANIILETFVAHHCPLPPADGPTVVIRAAHLARQPAWWSENAGSRWNLEADAPASVTDGIRRLAHDVFGYPELRPGQLTAILQVLHGHDSVVLLPTGSGKSLIYQLTGLLRPGLCLVVDPIRSLIDDQERRLLSLGINRVAALHAERAATENARSDVQRHVASGEALFAFITPERMLNQAFREALSAAAAENTINLAVVDEAHCVSEWGHSFRTAFLRLGTNLRRFGRDRHDVPPPLLALTGTASPAVLADTLRELDIDGTRPGALQRPDSFDRPNLRYEFLVGRPGEQGALLREAVLQRVPSITGLSPEETTGASGIIFVPHVNGSQGLHQSRRLTREALELPGEQTIGIYGGKEPKEYAKGRRAWEEEKRTTASNFVEGRLPLLVATKAFGMGIDKPDIRFTVHLGYPSSIEAFAQEAGRAGRDGSPSACIVISALPQSGMSDEDVQSNVDSPADAKKSPNRRSRDDDWSTQLWLLNQSFESHEKEVKLAIELYESVRRSGARGGAYLDLPGSAQGDGDKGAMKLLYRLTTVGVVDDVEYVGGNVLRVHFAYFDDGPDEQGIFAIDRALLDFLQRNDPGRLRQHEMRIATAPAEIDARVRHHLSLAVGAVYDVIYPARLRALEAMHQLVADQPDDDEARSRIVAYLDEGPMATNLQELVAAASVSVDRALQLFDASPPSSAYEWQGAADRMLESFPRHPLVLSVRAVGETRTPQGRPERFGGYLEQLLQHLPEFGLSRADEEKLLGWILRQVRSHPQHARRGWLEWAWAAFESTGYSRTPVASRLMDLVLKNAARGNLVPEELNSIVALAARRGAELEKGLEMEENHDD